MHSYALDERLTILRDPSSPADPQALALGALGWLLESDARAERFLALTGLTPDELRAGLGDPAALPAMLGAVLDFLAAHEPDLVGAAEALGVEPAVLAAAGQGLLR
ncbi:DUF3572 family protein [Novosphingobium flavum]|uniref:DUF3572 family protein n=1 Tax=Novosphingobium flavum TaxID=1778672 RepID=A0A7X1FQH2_9SPHN|nr:DUF3572 family protein [Novosphingobium flavum]